MLQTIKNIRNSFLILILLTGNSFAKDIRLPKDVGSGNSYSKSLGSGFKKHGYKIARIPYWLNDNQVEKEIDNILNGKPTYPDIPSSKQAKTKPLPK